jgi:hypothetical protein
MIAKLKFNLEKQEDAEHFDMICNASNMHSALFQIKLNLKKQIKYKLEDMDRFDALDLVFDEINSIFEEYNINIE